MTALFVILALLLVICLILVIPVGIAVRWKEGFFISLKVGFLKFPLHPKKEKKIRLRDFSKKNFEKMLERERRAEEKKAKKKKRDASSDLAKEGEEEKSSLLRGLYGMRKSVVEIVKAFGGHIRTDAVKIDVAVGAEDAAKCAVLYGVVSQFCAYVLEFLRSSTNMRMKKEAISVRADFEREKSEADIELHFSSRVIFALSFLMKFGLKYFDFTDKNN